MTISPARLFVLLAREAPIGVILRRGPTDWVQMIKWDTKRDTFEAGQWFHGRIYTDRCDLSPDGKLLIYFASKRTGKRMLEHKAIWTAVSKPPYFTALDIQFHIETWGGGGIFETAKTWFMSNLDHAKYAPFLNGRAPTVDRIRRHLDGWQIISEKKLRDSTWIHLTWQKQVKDYALTYDESRPIRKSQYTNCYSLKRGKLDGEISLAGVLWADFDYKGRLILAKEGKLYSATLHKTELKLSELVDFNANKPEQVVAPEWAQKW